MIPKASYYDESVFDQEMALLFGRGFQFAALSSELAKDRDFVCLDYRGTSIVLQNFKGTIKAFQNVCSHRFNRIQTEERGNRPLMCSYHGWTYDRTGFPLGLPRREQFLGEDNAHLCLPEYPVEMCGKFVFIDLGGGAASLREHLGDFYDTLEAMSAYLGGETHFCGVPHAANWKLLVENVLECYHCVTVHRETFVPWGVGKLPISDAAFWGGHSSAHFPRQDQEREELRQRYLSHLAGRPFTHNSFYHIYIFPNLFISSSQGLSFYVGQLLPRSAEQTLLRMRNYEPNVELSPKHRARQDPINADSVATGQKLIEEDRAILENVQKGIRIAERPGVLGEEEVRIRAFHDHYRSAVQRATQPVVAAAE